MNRTGPREVMGIQAAMHESLMAAMGAFRRLSEKGVQAAELRIEEIISIKHQLESIAEQRGYSRACKVQIPTCGGECCKWHFPRNLTAVDFLIAIFHMPGEDQAAFEELIVNSHGHQCPVLLGAGCFLSFEQRPVLCTNAYPCFSDRSYWNEKEKKKTELKSAFEALRAIVQRKRPISFRGTTA